MEIEIAYREIAPKLQSYLTGNGCSYAAACDIVQETFLRIWKQRESLSDDLHQVSGLAFTIARNCRNDLARKARRETLGTGSGVEDSDSAEIGSQGDVRPGEAAEERAALRIRLKSTLGRMPVQLLETFALSRLGKLSVKDIASGTETSESNVKVRVHRARELFKTCFGDQTGEPIRTAEPARPELVALKAMMMLAATDGEISKAELSLYRSLAQEFRRENAAAFGKLWKQSVRAMAYIGFLSEMLSPEELVCEYVREVGAIPRHVIAELERMAAADGDYSNVERACISALMRQMTR